jgi:hypothetical protein
MAKLDRTKTNIAIERLLAVTENPRHRLLRMAYYRHRFLEIAGRYEAICVPEMMVEDPVYHVRALGITATREGQEAVKGLCSMWAQTNQSIFYNDDEQVAVADNCIATVATVYQQTLGQALIAHGIHVDDENAMYHPKAFEETIWPYDDRGRLVGEDVWEPDPAKAEISKLDPADVITAQEAARLLNPLLKPLPSCDEVVEARIVEEASNTRYQG